MLYGHDWCPFYTSALHVQTFTEHKAGLITNFMPKEYVSHRWRCKYAMAPSVVSAASKFLLSDVPLFSTTTPMQSSVTQHSFRHKFNAVELPVMSPLIEHDLIAPPEALTSVNC
mmetsp:Transcript_119361/g.230266  ORF Transcript_119361/g.230266 Transcript_119361/m.230266 type:complete len:114 (-) Transcript_119361:742-1083(-)